MRKRDLQENDVTANGYQRQRHFVVAKTACYPYDVVDDIFVLHGHLAEGRAAIPAFRHAPLYKLTQSHRPTVRVQNRLSAQNPRFRGYWTILTIVTTCSLYRDRTIYLV